MESYLRSFYYNPIDPSKIEDFCAIGLLNEERKLFISLDQSSWRTIF